MSNMRSASSSTNVVMLSSLINRRFIKSFKRPGVPIIKCGRRFKSRICRSTGTPPTTRAEYRFNPIAKARNSSSICCANSRVGAMIKTLGRSDTPVMCSIIGNKNAAVLPVPVLAIPITSLPSMIGVMA